MACKDCNDECRQGRDCPHRLTYTDYHQRYLTLMQSIKQWISKITTKR
jgi:hypothetical protein